MFSSYNSGSSYGENITSGININGMISMTIFITVNGLRIVISSIGLRGAQHRYKMEQYAAIETYATELMMVFSWWWDLKGFFIFFSVHSQMIQYFIFNILIFKTNKSFNKNHPSVPFKSYSVLYYSILTVQQSAQ